MLQWFFSYFSSSFVVFFLWMMMETVEVLLLFLLFLYKERFEDLALNGHNNHFTMESWQNPSNLGVSTRSTNILFSYSISFRFSFSLTWSALSSYDYIATWTKSCRICDFVFCFLCVCVHCFHEILKSTQTPRIPGHWENPWSFNSLSS